MDPQKQVTKFNHRKWCAVFGAFLILLPTSFPKTWGNFSVYVLSYFYSKNNLTSELISPWVVSTYIISMNVALVIGGRFTFLKRNLLIVIGILMFNIGMITCYVALEYAITSLVFTGVALIGLSVGTLDSHVFKNVAECAGTQKGFMMSMASSGISFGPCVINSLVTMYVNPDNAPPDVIISEIRVFSQRTIVEKTPFMFLIYGATSFMFQAIGFILLLQKPKGNNSLKATNDSNYGSVSSKNEGIQERRADTSNDNKDGASVVDMDSQDDLARKQDLENCASVKEQREFAPLQTLRYNAFHILWLSYACAMFSELFLSNFYKTFGMTYISDDHFLALLGSVIGVTGGLARMSWGVVLDRYGIKTCMVFLYSSIGNVLLFMYFTCWLNKWLYFITTVVLGSLLACLYPSYVTITSTIFGLKHFNDNLGLLCSAPLLVGFIAPPIFNVLLIHVGWYALFDWSALCVTISLISIVIKFPRR